MQATIAVGLMCGALFAAAAVAQVTAPTSSARNTVLALDHGWQFRQVTHRRRARTAGWLPATVPGDVHLDLLANKKIPDPFYRDNESKLQWIENESWEYRLNFDATPALLCPLQHRSRLRRPRCGRARSISTASRCSIADNMFRIWRVPVKGHLHAGSNPLRVVFPSPITAAAQVAATRSMAAKNRDRPQDLHPQSRL